MNLLNLRGGWLFETRPDILPDGYLTDVELLLWQYFYEERKKIIKR